MHKSFIDFIKKEPLSRTLLITCGLPASGKTSATALITRFHDFHLLRSDTIRLELLKGEDIFDEKVASDMKKRLLVYDEMFKRADELSEKGKSVVLDASFITQALRRRAAEVAARHDMTLFIQETRCPKEVSLRRIAGRTKENYESNALTEKAYTNNLKRFEPVDVDDLKKRYPDLYMVHIIVDTTSDSIDEWFIINVERY